MVCVQCYLDAAAPEIIEYCINKDFTKDLSFSSTGNRFEIQNVDQNIKKTKVSTEKIK